MEKFQEIINDLGYILPPLGFFTLLPLEIFCITKATLAIIKREEKKDDWIEYSIVIPPVLFTCAFYMVMQLIWDY